MAAEGHVIGVEGLPAAKVVVHGCLHHLQIGGGPVDLYIRPGVRRLEGIAHVGVGDVPVVEIADIVVIAPGLVALFLQGVTQAEGQIVGARHVEAGIRLSAGHIRVKSHAHGVLAVGGDGLERAVVIIEDNARVGQLVQGGRQLLADEPGAEALGTDGDQVVVLQKPGVVVLPGGDHLRQVFVRGFAHGIIRGLRQLCKVDALDHIIGIAAVEPSGVCTQRGRRDDDAAAAAKDHVAKLLHGGGQHAHALIAAVGRGVHIGEGFVDGERFTPPGVHNTHRSQQQRQQDTQRRQRLPPLEPHSQHPELAQSKAEDRHDQRYQQQKDGHDVLADAVQDLRVEIGDDVPTHAHLTDGHEVAENGVVHQLHLGKQHLHGDQKHAHDLSGDLGQVRGQQRADRSTQQSEQHQIDRPPVQRAIDAQVQAQLHIDAGAAEQQQAAEPFLPQAAAWGSHRSRCLMGCLGLIRYLIGFCLQHICLLPQVSLRGRPAKSVKILARGISYCKCKEIAMISVKIKERFTVAPVVLSRKFSKICIAETRKPCYTVREFGNAVDFRR